MDEAHEKRGTRSFVDAVLFGFFVYDGFTVPGLPGHVPGSDAAAVVIVGLATFRRPRRSLAATRWFIPFWIIILTYLVFVTLYNEGDWFRRAFRIVIMVALVVAIVTERVELRAGLYGLGIALFVNVLLFYAGIAPDNYGGVLTGYLGDKNVAGLYYTIVPLILMALARRRRHQILCLVSGAFTVFLTGSRTSLAAYAGALLWMGLSRRLGPLPRIALLVLLALGLQYLEDKFARIGIFSDRLGSDLLRERIEHAAIEKADSAPWYGLGLGESVVNTGAQSWFFHDSYLGLYVEGGWVLLVAIVGLYIWVGLRLFSATRHTYHERIIEAASVALLICASKLGEVFLSLPGFILLAFALVNLTDGRPSTASNRMAVGVSTAKGSS